MKLRYNYKGYHPRSENSGINHWTNNGLLQCPVHLAWFPLGWRPNDTRVNVGAVSLEKRNAAKLIAYAERPIRHHIYTKVPVNGAPPEVGSPHSKRGEGR